MADIGRDYPEEVIKTQVNELKCRRSTYAGAGGRRVLEKAWDDRGT